jgi:glycosyltransferase involved in cell wall biosynthesis
MAFAMTGELYRNSRALKQLRSLSAAGYIVEVWHLAGQAPAVALPPSITVHDLVRPSGKGPLFFRQVGRLFEEALSDVRADIVHASDLYALAACRRRADTLGCALTYDAREYYPHVAGTVRKPWARWWWRHVERSHILRADAVFTVSDSIANTLRSDYGIQRPRVVHNAPPTSLPDGANPVQSLRDRIQTKNPVFVHLGQMKAQRGGPILLEALRSVDSAHLVFLGYGSEMNRMQDLARMHGLSERVHFFEPVSPDAIRDAIRDADVGITMLEDTCLNHRYALPNKLFDYIHAGLPVLGADLPEIRAVIARHDIGMTASPNYPEHVAEAMKAMLDTQRQSRWRAHLSAARKTYSWEEASLSFLTGVDQALGRRSAAIKDPS